MLRISINKPINGTATLHLEGHIAGPWITELRGACEQLLVAGSTLTLDLGDVSLIERPGFDLLASLSRRAVTFVNCSPFQEEQLRQAIAAHSDSNAITP